MEKEKTQNDYNYYTSICDVCYQRGWHIKPVKCTRKRYIPCECCGSHENGKIKECTGTNVVIDYSNISQKFAPYYHSNKRIKVGFCDDNGDGDVYETRTGTVSMTTGWKPSLMLMLRSNSIESSYLLSDNDIII